jgi:hypothetical protein
VCAALYALDPTLPPVWRGADLSPEGVAAIASAAVVGRAGGSAYDSPPEVVKALLEQRLLERLAQWTGRRDLADIDQRWRGSLDRWGEVVKRLPSGMPKPDHGVVRARLLRAAATVAGDDELLLAAQPYDGDWLARCEALRKEVPDGSLITASAAGLLAVTVFGDQLRRADQSAQPAQEEPATTAPSHVIGKGVRRLLALAVVLFGAITAANIVELVSDVRPIEGALDGTARDVLSPLLTGPAMVLAAVVTLLASALASMAGWSPGSPARRRLARLVALTPLLLGLFIVGGFQQWW